MIRLWCGVYYWEIEWRLVYRIYCFIYSYTDIDQVVTFFGNLNERKQFLLNTVYIKRLINLYILRMFAINKCKRIFKTENCDSFQIERHNFNKKKCSKYGSVFRNNLTFDQFDDEVEHPTLDFVWEWGRK